MKYKAIVKINVIPKIKCCFFDTFQAEVEEKNEKMVIKSLKTEKVMEARREKVNNALFGSGKLLAGLLIMAFGFYNYLTIFPLKVLLLLTGFWIFAIMVCVYFMKDEDVTLFVMLIITSLYLALINKFSIVTVDYLATNAVFFIGSVFVAKGIKETLYDIQDTAKSLNNNFILKIKKIEEE